jgi:hypothetical protein
MYRRNRAQVTPEVFPIETTHSMFVEPRYD